MEIEALERSLPGLRFPREPGRDYETLAGFVVTYLGRVPKEGESLEWLNHQFEVIDMDRHRVDKVLITPQKSSQESKVPPAPDSAVPRQPGSESQRH